MRTHAGAQLRVAQARERGGERGHVAGRNEHAACAVRDDLGMPEVTSHSFRKTVATLIDDAGLSARIGADHLGHAKVSMTQDRYMSRGRVHTQVADLLDRAVTDINDE